MHPPRLPTPRAPAADTACRPATFAARRPAASASLLLAATLALLAGGCGEAPLQAVQEGRPVEVLVLGDSLSAGYRLAPGDGWVERLAERLAVRGVALEVHNMAVAGAVAEDGHGQLARFGDGPVDLAFVALGGNDGLRKRSPRAMGDALSKLVGTLLARGARVVLLGVRLPFLRAPASFRDTFHEAFDQVAAAHDVPLLPSLLADVTGHPSRLLDDGLHPNAAGQRLMAERVLAFLDELGWLASR